jgi:hypothetical protein
MKITTMPVAIWFFTFSPSARPRSLVLSATYHALSVADLLLQIYGLLVPPGFLVRR